MNGSRPLEFISGAVPKSEKVARTIQIFRFGPVKMRRNVQAIAAGAGAAAAIYRAPA